MNQESISVLDNGFVRLTQSWGSDEDIIRAARQSTDGAFRGWTKEDGSEGDIKLLRYLYTHKHMSPFEMAGATFEIKAPIFVFREWHR
jgi:thymidylate synthase (FAD)